MVTGYSNRRFCVSLLILGIFCGLTACAGIPVQEMSDARQAIRAAQDAGAATTAPGEIERAQELLSRAEASMQNRQFRQARQDATEARRIATSVLQAAQRPTT